MPAFQPAFSDYLLTAFLLLLIVINAIVSGSELAFFKIEESKKESVTKLLRKPEKLLASIILTYNLLNVTIAILTIYLLNRIPYFGGPIRETLILEIVIVICIIVLLIDLFPKLIASHNPLSFAEKNVSLINLTTKIMSPFSTFFVKNTKIFNRNIDKMKHDISVDDLTKALEITSNEISFNHEKEMLEGIIRFRDKNVDDIKISRSDMTAVDSQTQFETLIEFIVDAGFSRIPVYDITADHIIGILYVKDLLSHLGKPTNFKWQSLLRPPYFVPGTKRIDELLEEFRTNKIHMAIVVDEYGGTSGLVTMEDILEEIVGDISDEYDEELPFYTIAADGSYIFEGKTQLEDFIKITNLSEKDFEEMSDEVDTLAGLLLELKGDFPKRKESFTYKKYTFVADEMSKKRIIKVRYIPPRSTIPH